MSSDIVNRKPTARVEINSIKDLPTVGYPIENFDKKIKVPDSVQGRFTAWSSIPEGEKKGPTGHPILLLVSEKLKMDVSGLSSVRANAKKEGFVVEQIKVASNETLDALKEYKTTAATVVQDEDNVQIAFFEEMLGVSLREVISDIHLEKRNVTSEIRLRKHGELNHYKFIPSEFAKKVSSVIYNVLGENKDVSFMPNQYQAASIDYRLNSTSVKLRYQSLPVYPDDSFDIVMRVLPLGEEESGTPEIIQLGYSQSQSDEMFNIVAKPVGALIIAGTTGSGKSTTLKNLLMIINEMRQYRSKIYTVEDPPEYKIPRVSQIPVVRRKDIDYTLQSPFMEPLIATMRADPDVLMIGEVRDIYTGDGLKKATQSGHTVLTTTHASSALGSVERLADFGITPSVMGSPEFINGLIYQKLLPVLCPHCSFDFAEKFSNPEFVTKRDLDLKSRIEQVYGLSIGHPEMKIRYRNHDGCDECKKLGVIGRTVCAEIIEPDSTMLKLFRETKAIEAKAYWLSLSDKDMNSDNMTGKSALEHALYKMKQGICSPYDVEVNFGRCNSTLLSRQAMMEDEATKEYFKNKEHKKDTFFGNPPSNTSPKLDFQVS